MGDVKESNIINANISLKLNDYSDIFSDFDPRPYSHRALSGDFLEEAKRASRDKINGELILQFVVLSKNRNESNEILIKRRLREHFKKHYLMLLNDAKLTKERGVLMTFAGVLFIAIAAYISSLNFEGFLSHFAIVLLEPAGWFTAWTGLDEIYYTVRQKKPDLDFYEKMSNAEIVFLDY